MSATTADRELAGCTKCTSEIPVEADRCPECGYEPSPGILGGIVMWIAFSIGMLFALIAVVSGILVFDGFPIMDAFYVFAFTGAIAAVCFGIVYSGYHTAKRGPTDPALGEGNGESESVTDSWKDGEEIGEEIGERINSLGPATVDALPEWTWTAGVILGVALNFSVWVTAVMENESAMMIGIFGGGVLLFLSIVTDAYRLNWADNDLHFRWWFYSILAFLPLIGWLFGLAWLARKRQKTGSLIG